jgi:hypothetical protein
MHTMILIAPSTSTELKSINADQTYAMIHLRLWIAHLLISIVLQYR